MKCHFCDSKDLFEFKKGAITFQPSQEEYLCPRCGHIYLSRVAAEDFEGAKFTPNKKMIISIHIRNEYERRDQQPFTQKRTYEELHQIVKQYRPLDAIDRMDKALSNIEKTSKYIGQSLNINYKQDFPYFHCFEPDELFSILSLLSRDGFTYTQHNHPAGMVRITTKGYERLRELKRRGKESKQCFVAMILMMK